ncbi:MAG: 8-amino-7-oxononanoate synthase [Caulobacteraceae bacterium]|nr:8-amino-7-oxononanoate synthase [Caulobacteraceae bacterium]
MTDRAASSLDDFALTKLAALEAQDLRRRLKPTHRLDGLWAMRNGRRMLSFSCNDYLNLSHHPKVREAAKVAIDLYGAGSGASRLITGDFPLLEQLEQRLVRLKGTEACCLFGSGYLANAGVISALVGPGDIIFLDALSHSSMWTGARLSGAKIVAFAHNDMADLARLIAEHRAGAERALVASEGVFSMDGDLAPQDLLSKLCLANDAWLYIDDAHGVGVLGEGRGAKALFPSAVVPLQMGTLSKALGSYGAYVCASHPAIDFLKTRVRTLIYSTAPPPSAIAAALAALDVIEQEPERCARPVAKARLFTRALNLPDAESAVVPVIIGEAAPTLAASARLEDEGFLVVPIRPPTVPAGAARLRVAFTADHPDAEIERLADAMRPLIPA